MKSPWSALSLLLLPTLLLAQGNNPSGVPVSVVVTHEVKHNAEEKPLTPQDVVVREGKTEAPVLDLKPAGQNGAVLQLLIMIDDSARGSFGTQIPTLKQFVAGLPETTEVGVGYMRNGMTAMSSPFTRDHQTAANSIRLALGAGGADVSPYDSLSDAVHKWPQSNAERREVIMISSGVEALGGGYAPDNPYVNKGIQDAQRAGVVVHTIYNPSAGGLGRSFWRNSWSQSFLSQLADETGGEAYNLNMGSPVSIQPFLEEIGQRLGHQYILAFAAKPENKAGLQPIKVQLKERDGSIAAPSRVYVKAGM